MQTSILLSTVCAVVLAGCSAAVVEQDSKFANQSELVCRDVVPVGSHLKERVCMTKSENKEDSNQAKRVLEEAQQRRAADALMQRGGQRYGGP
jgi:hypothetical protein